MTMRLIDADALFDFMSEQLAKETGAYSKGRNAGIHIARSALHNYELTPAIDPVHAAGGCYCDECVMSNDECMAEFRFREEGVKNPFCCLGYPPEE